MKELIFRTLTPDEIDVRVDQIIDTPKFLGCRVLLYKDARVDMNLLDEVVKPLNWKREHKRDNANCVVSIWDEEKREWISKEDTGSESNQDKEKGLASDSFKRACVNWGIGRELYSAPKTTFIKLSKEDFYESNGKKYLNKNIKFFVKEIDYDDKRNINYLVIIDQDGNTVYEFHSNGKPAAKKAEPKPKAEKPAEKKKEAPQAKPETRKMELTAEQEEMYTEMCSDIDSADKVASVLATCLMAEGQPYELAIRKKAAKRGIDLATSRDEISQAYDLIKDREGWEEMKAYAMTTVKTKGLK